MYNFKKIKYKKESRLEPGEDQTYLSGDHEDYETVRNKYVWLNNKKSYGRTCHGKHIFSEDIQKRFLEDGVVLQDLDITSILDIGTGKGQMCNLFKENGYRNIYGLDFAITPLEEFKNKGITFLQAPAHDIPLPDKSIDLITSFDFLEHVHPDYLEKSIKEMVRVGKKYMLHKIANGPSKSGHSKVGQLHTIQEDHRFWINQVLIACNETKKLIRL